MLGNITHTTLTVNILTNHFDFKHTIIKESHEYAYVVNEPSVDWNIS